MKENLLLVGCGEYMRVVIDNIEDIGGISIFGIVTSIPEDVGKRIYGYEVIGTNEDIDDIFSSNADITGYFLTVGQLKDGDMSKREALYKKLDTKYRTINLVHPTSVVSKHTRIGTGNLFEAFTRIANETIIGSHCIINPFTAVNHNQIIGNNVLLAGNVSMAGYMIGDNTIIADGASIGFKRIVGRNCIIGDGAVVTKDIPDNSIAYGNHMSKLIEEANKNIKLDEE